MPPFSVWGVWHGHNEGKAAIACQKEHIEKITLKPASPIRLTAIHQVTDWLCYDLVSGSW